jgi:hypothetical protein
MNNLEMAQAMKRLFVDGMESGEAAVAANPALARLFDDWLSHKGFTVDLEDRPFATINRLCSEAGLPPLPLWQIIGEVVIAQRLVGPFLPSAGSDSE